eukprot:Clim_evm7s200 gene=Clim_evmTU7s200
MDIIGKAMGRGYNPTPEEKEVLKSCSRQAAVRGMVWSLGSMLLTWRVVQSTKFRTNNRLKGFAIGTSYMLGFYVGIVSYGPTAVSRVLELENSPLAEHVRKHLEIQGLKLPSAQPQTTTVGGNMQKVEDIGFSMEEDTRDSSYQSIDHHHRTENRQSDTAFDDLMDISRQQQEDHSAEPKAWGDRQPTETVWSRSQSTWKGPPGSRRNQDLHQVSSDQGGSEDDNSIGYQDQETEYYADNLGDHDDDNEHTQRQSRMTFQELRRRHRDAYGVSQYPMGPKPYPQPNQPQQATPPPP